MVTVRVATSVSARALKDVEGAEGPFLQIEIAMWIIFTRAPRPDAPYWPGRRWLAALDAVAWPVAWAVVVARAPMQTGIVGMLSIACTALFAVSRLQRALLRNKRYRFTTWRWGRALTVLLLLGLMMKLTVIA